MYGSVKRDHDSEVGDQGGRRATLGDLVRETADGMGRLVIEHMKLAQLEIVGGLRSLVGRGAAIAVYLVLFLVGYTLAMTGVCILLGDSRTLAVPFLVVGGLHLGVAILGMLVTVARLRKTSLIPATTTALNQSAGVLITASHDLARSASGRTGATLEQVNRHVR